MIKLKPNRVKKRTLLGQILTVVIYFYNTASVGFLFVMIAGLIGSNSIADKYGDSVPSLTGVNPLGAILSFLFVGIVWFIFYFILKKFRDAAELKEKDVLIEAYNSFLKRTLLGQILTIAIYLFNIAALGLMFVCIYFLLNGLFSANEFEFEGIFIVILIFLYGFWWVIYKILQLFRDEAGLGNKKNITNKAEDKGSLSKYFSKRKSYTSNNNAIDELKKMKELLDLELITQEEFNKKSKELKKIILGN